MLEQNPSLQDQRFRLDVHTHDNLMRPPRPAAPPPKTASVRLPEPVYPRFLERLGDVEPDPNIVPNKERLSGPASRRLRSGEP